MRTEITSNPFALMMEPERVLRAMDSSTSLRKLAHRRCQPLDRPIIRSASADLAAFDAKIDRTTVYLPPDEAAANDPVAPRVTDPIN